MIELKQTKTYDPAAALMDDEEIAFFMADAFETGDANYIAKALGVVARAKGMTEIAQKTGLSREQLYRSFGERGNPTLKTTLAVMRALGIDMTAKPHTAAWLKRPDKNKRPSRSLILFLCSQKRINSLTKNSSLIIHA